MYFREAVGPPDCNFSCSAAYGHGCRAALSDRKLEGNIDAALVERAVQGESVAFELLVVKYQRRVAATIRRLVFDDRIVEELTQEVFLNLFSALPSFRPDGDFAAWLFTIARNTAKSYLRSAQNRQDDRPTQTSDEHAEASNTRRAPSPEEQAMARQMFECIDAAVAALPALQRQALLMREVDGLDYKGIATAMDLPINTVKSHLYRARESISRLVSPLLAPTRDQRW